MLQPNKNVSEALDGQAIFSQHYNI